MPPPSKPQFDPINPSWLLKAIAYTLFASLICGYLTLCLLFYQGQWQLVLYPQHNSNPLTSLAGLPAQPILFDAAETGTPRLSGVLLPARVGARYESYTVLYLRGGSASLAISPVDAQYLAILHDLGLNVFAFDYRGYGQSDPIHPTQARMTEDASAALRYLRDTRSIPEKQILPFGVGEGASFAVSIASAHRAIPALIVAPRWQSPLSDVLSQPHTRLLPVRALFNQTFSLNTLATLETPKLLLLDTTRLAEREPVPPAADPRFTLELNPAEPSHAPDLSAGISRFLDQTLPHPLNPIKK